VIAIVNYGVGNIKSILKAIELVGGRAVVTRDPDDIEKAKGIVLPGVGAFKTAMENMREIEKMIRETDVPVLGICLGMQLFATESEEKGIHRGLNVIPGRVVRFPKEVGKIPHMGWNKIKIVKNHRILKGVKDNSYVYFVHSYYMITEDEYVLTKTEYTIEFASGVFRDNFVGFQFHPEKSGRTGLKIIKNFVDMCSAE